ncbi:MAG: GatB/YqeY domain-containing protein, partial [Candidatus Latescibacterota bacterium]
YKEAGRSDLAEKEEYEYDLTISYLPPQMDEDELVSLIGAKIEETGAQGMKDFGRVMKAVMEVVGGRADGSAVSALVKNLMSKQK